MADSPVTSTTATHPDRKEIARYPLARGLDPVSSTIDPARTLIDLGHDHTIAFPAGLETAPAPISPEPGQDDPLPEADVVIITWTVDEGRPCACSDTECQPGSMAQVRPGVRGVQAQNPTACARCQSRRGHHHRRRLRDPAGQGLLPPDHQGGEAEAGADDRHRQLGV